MINFYKNFSYSHGYFLKYFCTNTKNSQCIQNLIDKAPKKVVVFMKGTKESPKCGFSNAVAKIFEMHGVDIYDIDVLENEKIRNAIKEYSNWPTIPQIYINKEFIGGCDILLQMHKNGELVEELKKAGIISKIE
ncbi:unnamed protein product [Gordionus sp. m RMFG-2023]